MTLFEIMYAIFEIMYAIFLHWKIDNLLFKGSFFSTETSILEMYYGCFFICWSAKSSFNYHKMVFSDNKTVAFSNRVILIYEDSVNMF